MFSNSPKKTREDQPAWLARPLTNGEAGGAGGGGTGRVENTLLSQVSWQDQMTGAARALGTEHI